MTRDVFMLFIVHIGSSSMSNRHTYRSLYAINQYVSIIRALNTWKSQDTKQSEFEDTKGQTKQWLQRRHKYKH